MASSAKAEEAIHPFNLSIPQEHLDNLQSQLSTAQPPTTDLVPDAGEDYGIPTAWANSVLTYWRQEFSWRKVEERINSLPAFTTVIEDLTIHFVHQRSVSDGNAKPPIPLLLIHGWPGTFHEFHRLIPLLSGTSDAPVSNSETEAKRTFHCVAPSLPGFCFSSAPARRGWTVKDTARVFHTLMLRLGYETYMVQAGDWGQFVARELGANPAYVKSPSSSSSSTTTTTTTTNPSEPNPPPQKKPDGCALIHLNWCPGALPSPLSPPATTRELAAQAKANDWRSEHIGYAVLMRTRPQTLSWLLPRHSNPLGHLCLIGEKYHEASNPSVHLQPFWLDHIVTTVGLYYFTHCVATAALVYYDNPPHHFFAEEVGKEENRIRCAFGYSSYWFDTAPNSERAVEGTGWLVRYRERDYAGHFAAVEDPEGVEEDVRALVEGWWEG